VTGPARRRGRAIDRMRDRKTRRRPASVIVVSAALELAALPWPPDWPQVRSAGAGSDGAGPVGPRNGARAGAETRARAGVSCGAVRTCRSTAGAGALPIPPGSAAPAAVIPAVGAREGAATFVRLARRASPRLSCGETPWRGGSSPHGGATAGRTVGGSDGSGGTAAAVAAAAAESFGAARITGAAGVADVGTWAAASMPATAVAAAAPICCTTSPESPGLATRTDRAMLHATQTVAVVTDAGGGGAPLQLQCQFHTITVAPEGAWGRPCGAVAGSQFHVQFQTKVCAGAGAASGDGGASATGSVAGAIGDTDGDSTGVCGVVLVIPSEFGTTLFAVSPAAGGGAAEEGAADCEGCGTPAAVGGAGGTGGAGTIGSATSPWGPVGGTGSGIAAETDGTTGVCGTTTAGVAVCDGGWVAAATIAAASGTDGCGSAPHAGATAIAIDAATTQHSETPIRRESQATSP
jgi:hypothetical protein